MCVYLDTLAEIMAVSWRRYHRPSLESQVWVSVKIGGSEWLVKSLFQEDSYEVMITDCCTAWGERLEERAIARKSKVI